MSTPNREGTQQRAFIAYLNTVLPSNNRMESLKDLHDGVKFILVIEKLTNTQLKGTSMNPRNVFEKLSNVRVVLDYMVNQCQIRLISITPNMIVDNNEKIILALIWHIILHFQIATLITTPSNNSSSKVRASGNESHIQKEMMSWISNKAEGQPQVKNFTTDWQDGQLLKSLIKSLRKIDDPQVEEKLLGSNPKQLNQSCVSYAEKEMNIPAILSADDISEVPDKLAMMTYISFFANYEQEKKKNPPSNNQSNEELKNEKRNEQLENEKPNEQMRNELERLKKENEQLKREKHQANNRESEIKAHLEQLQKQLESSIDQTEYSDILQELLRMVRTSIKELEKQQDISKLRDEYDELNRKRTQELERHSSQLNRAREIILKQESLISTLTEQLTALKTNFQSMSVKS